MKIVKLKAGLGNQMFQYAFMVYLKEQYSIEDVRLDTAYYDNEFKKYLDFGLNLLNVKYNIASRRDLKQFHIVYNNFKPHSLFHRLISGIQALLNKAYFFEKNRDYVDVGLILHFTYYDGYWQSWRYLQPIRDTLLNEFKPKSSISMQSMEFIMKYRTRESVFVGIRRGDYTESAKNMDHYGVPSIDYYKRAIQLIKEKVNDPYFVVFSDDIDWVKENMDFKQTGVKESQLEYREKTSIVSNFEELFVMASCKHAIISNSTFNFWGAWLIENPRKTVVAPKDWFKDGKPIDIIPPTWIQL